MAFNEVFRGKIILGIEDTEDKRERLLKIAKDDNFECDKPKTTKYVNMNLIYCVDKKEHLKQIQKLIYYVVYVFDNSWANGYKIDEKKKKIYIIKNVFGISSDFRTYEIFIYDYDTEEDIDFILSSVFEGASANKITKSYFELLDEYTGIKKKLGIMLFASIIGGIVLFYLFMPEKKKKNYFTPTTKKEVRLSSKQSKILKFVGSKYILDQLLKVSKRYVNYTDKVRIAAINGKMTTLKDKVSADLSYTLEFNFPAVDTTYKGKGIWAKTKSISKDFSFGDYAIYRNLPRKSKECVEYALKSIDATYIDVKVRKNDAVEISSSSRGVKPSIAIGYLKNLTDKNCFININFLTLAGGKVSFDYYLYY